MSKFEPLTAFLSSLPTSERRIAFSEIERVLGFKLPPSARRHRPWWSNNPGNSTITKAWLAAGFRTEQVDMAGETLVFRRAEPRSPAAVSPMRSHVENSRKSPFGGLKRTVKIAANFDLTEPTGEVWAAGIRGGFDDRPPSRHLCCVLDGQRRANLRRSPPSNRQRRDPWQYSCLAYLVLGGTYPRPKWPPHVEHGFPDLV